MEGSQSAKKMIRVLRKSFDCKGVANTARRTFAHSWWRNYLKVMDFMPKCAAPAHPCIPAPAHVYGLRPRMYTHTAHVA
jgi:hypothetical protein